MLLRDAVIAHDCQLAPVIHYDRKTGVRAKERKGMQSVLGGCTVALMGPGWGTHVLFMACLQPMPKPVHLPSPFLRLINQDLV